MHASARIHNAICILMMWNADLFAIVHLKFTVAQNIVGSFQAILRFLRITGSTEAMLGIRTKIVAGL